jgi:hypothetical protein
MGGSRAAGAALGLVVVTTLLLAVGVVLVVLPTGSPSGEGAELAFTLAFVPPVAAFAVVGGLISRRHPRHPVGWLLGAIGALFALVVACSNGSRWALTSGRLPTGIGEWLDVGSNAWVVALGLLGTQLPLRLPDGHLPSPRWRWFSRLTVLLVAVAVVGMVAQPGRVEGVPGTSNPLGATWAARLQIAFFVVILTFLACFVSLVLRYRRSGQRDRAQLRWVAFGGAAFLVVYLVALPFTI